MLSLVHQVTEIYCGLLTGVEVWTWRTGDENSVVMWEREAQKMVCGGSAPKKS